MSRVCKGKSTFEKKKKQANTLLCLRPRPRGLSKFAFENFEGCDLEPKSKNKESIQVCLVSKFVVPGLIAKGF